MGDDKYVYRLYFKSEGEEYQEEIIAEDIEQAISFLNEIVPNIYIITKVKQIRRYNESN